MTMGSIEISRLRLIYIYHFNLSTNECTYNFT